MTRIAAALLIVLTTLGVEGGTFRPAFAESLPPAPPRVTIDAVQPVAVRSGRVLALLIVLEAVRRTQSPGGLPRP